MSKVLVIAEHANGILNGGIAKTVACARALEPEALEVLVAGDAPEAVAAQAAELEGVTRVCTLSGAAYAHPLAATLAPAIQAVVGAGDYTHLLGPNTTYGKDLMPRAAALLGVAQITDIQAVHGAYRFERPIYAGNAIITVEAPSDQLVVGTVRLASYTATGEQAAAPIEALDVEPELPGHTRFIEISTATGGERPDLQSAPRVVSGGRGVGSGENFSIIYQLADKLGAAVGASRAAVDAGFVANDLQVGQTGKIIAPELYVAVGISGAIQHLAGIKDAGTIVAINSDPDAPIFEIADIGLVGDLFEVLPELEKSL